VGDTAPEDVLHIPPDHVLEADFDPHEAPTKPGHPPGLSDEIIDVRDDLRALISSAAVLFESMTYSIDSARHTARIGDARFALSELAKKYGVTT
jgi:hypothetical protein